MATWSQVLAWRLRRQLLDPVGDGSVAQVVERLGAVPAWPDEAAELAVGVRRVSGRRGEVAEALAAADVVKVFTYRGATHLMTPGDAGAVLAVRASSRMWELASWVEHYDLAAGDWPAFRAAVRRILTDGPVTRTEVIAALARSARYTRVADVLASGNDTVLKPLSWQGDLSLGPSRDGEHTFVRLDAVPGWTGLPDLELAGPTVVEAFLRTYGPAPVERLTRWFAPGLGARSRDVTQWVASLGDRVTRLYVEGEPLLLMGDDVAELEATTASTALRLLPGRDVWVMAPGTADPRVVGPSRREAVSRSANLVVHRGRLAGTWALRRGTLRVEWFAEAGRCPRAALADEVERVGDLLGSPTAVEVTVAP